MWSRARAGEQLPTLACMLNRITGWGGLFVALVSACAPVVAPSQPASAARAIPADDGSAQIAALIGEPLCRADAECRVAPIGHQPCGGPESYRAWSVRTVREERALEQALAGYAESRRARHEKTGLMSTCQYRPPPGVYCRGAAAADGGACTLVPRGEAANR